MSLLLNGTKTMTFAGTEMQCLELYTGEAYTINLNFTDAGGTPIDTTSWGNLTPSAKWYTVDTVEYPNEDEVVLGNLTLDATQPDSNNYTILADWSNRAAGTGYLYIGADITGGSGTGNVTPVVDLANSSANSVLVITTIQIDRTDPVSSQPDINREPLGIIVRYQ
jgi:hypothetical protein